MEFDVRSNTKETENNLKQKGLFSDLQDKEKEAITEYWYMFCEDGFFGLSRDFHSRPTQVLIHLSTVNHLGKVLMSLR